MPSDQLLCGFWSLYLRPSRLRKLAIAVGYQTSSNLIQTLLRDADGFLGRHSYLSADRVGPEAPRGSRLGPDRENRLPASILGSTSTPTKQFCISSQF